jgi:asparagine synthase (glutamine-hydrolysing)
MSAIFGIIRFDDSDVATRDLERMSNLLAERGPDGRSFLVNGRAGLGHCLMRVNKEDHFEAQPLHDRKTGITLVADCRIDNREELADVLGIASDELRDMPDSALILIAYKKWGEDCAQHLLGDFAFAIWDDRAKKLLLGRDHMGQRSILYHRAPEFFAFATDPTALWALPDVPRQLSDTALGRHLLFANARRGNATLFEDIYHVPGGSIVAVSATVGLTERRYWRPQADPSWLNRTEDDYVEHYRSVVAEAVECRIRRLIRPPALCLSGGFDSAAIAGLAGPILAAQERKLIAVTSVLDEGEQSNGNARGSVEICRRHMPHLAVHYVARSHELGIDDLDRAFLRAKGIPTIDHNITDILFQEASSAGARLVMDGIGGDETINPRGGRFLQYLLRTRQFTRFLIEARAHLREGTRSLWGILWGDMFGQAAFPLRRGWRRLRHGAKAPWADRPIAADFAAEMLRTGAIDPAEIIVRLRRYASARANMEKILLRLMAMPAHHYANEAAARGLDLTRPMLDKRVVEFGRSIPEDLYVKHGRARHLARRALAGIYPAEFATRLIGRETRRPGYHDALRAELPKLRADIRRLSHNATLRKYVGFSALENGLARFDSDPAPVRDGVHTLRAFYAIRYIAWFNRSNLQ